MNGKFFCVFVVAVVMLFTLSKPAFADTKVFISISIGGGAVIGMIGYFIHVSYSTRVAEKERKIQSIQRKHPPLALKNTFHLNSPSPVMEWGLERRQHLPSTGIQINFLTYKW